MVFLRKVIWAILAASSVSSIAAAADAYTTANVSLRAGPSIEFPEIVTVPVDEPVSVYGCTGDWEWCDTNWSGVRGWVSGRHLEARYGGRRARIEGRRSATGLPVIRFDLSGYWDRNYQDQPWYDERDRWVRRWSDGGWQNGEHHGSSDPTEVPRSSRAQEALPPGIAKKPGFCPPGQAKKGRC
ncbi:SH3 domain-containing protein [Aquibium pacificus]|uniref:SH3 domain-containing protein n=1 Tax=Aquibium pacificus TaxID=3153579 RepID=UPI00349F2DC1